MLARVGPHVIKKHKHTADVRNVTHSNNANNVSVNVQRRQLMVFTFQDNDRSSDWSGNEQVQQKIQKHYSMNCEGRGKQLVATESRIKDDIEKKTDEISSSKGTRV